jgi:hypothetical protein
MNYARRKRTFFEQRLGLCSKSDTWRACHGRSTDSLRLDLAPR